MDWFSGYADADGCICKNEGNQSLQIASIEKEFLMDIKLMLQTFNTKNFSYERNSILFTRWSWRL